MTIIILHRKKTFLTAVVKKPQQSFFFFPLRFTMDPSEESPSSLWMVQAAELFPKANLEKEDDELIVPFSERNEKLFSNVAQFAK
jgi:hypothetical protein